MKRTEIWKKAVAVIMAAALPMTISACAASSSPSAPPSSGASGTPSKAPSASASPTIESVSYDKEITIDVYSRDANFQGIIGGYGGKIWKDRFNVKINIIAPNISGQAIFQTRSAAGHLGDLIVMNQADFRDIITAGLVMDITGLLAERAPNFSKYQNNIDVINRNIGADKTYVLPIQMTTLSPTDPLMNPAVGMRSYQDGAGTFLRWDVYEKIGMPEIGTMEDLLQVVKQMQEAHPTGDNGNQTFGFSIFKDWDGVALHNVINGFPQMYGYQLTPGTSSVITYGDSSEFKTQRIDDDDGLYYRTLKFYYTANKMGLLDPDSATQTWSTLVQKTRDGQILTGLWPWSTMTHYNNADRGNAEEPTGYQFVPIKDAKYFDKGYNPATQWGAVIALGSKAQDPERLIDILDWMSTPEGQMIVSYGERGMGWDLDSNGKPYLTDFALQAAADPAIMAPEEYGGGVYLESGPAFAQIFHPAEINPLYGVQYDTRYWDDYMAKNDTQLNRNWRAAMGAENMVDYLKKHNMSAIAAGNLYIAPQATPEMQSLRDICSVLIKNASWQMIYAEDDRQFESIWQDMKAQILASNWEEIVELDLKLAEEYVNACRETINNSK